MRRAACRRDNIGHLGQQIDDDARIPVGRRGGRPDEFARLQPRTAELGDHVLVRLRRVAERPTVRHFVADG